MLFEPNGRIEKTNGIRFYEQDIIFSEYTFQNDWVVNVTIDYLHSGFGFVIAEKGKGKPRDSDKAYLFKLGNNCFEVIQKNILIQSTEKENSCLFAPAITNTEAHVAFTIKGLNISLDVFKAGDNGKTEKENLGTYKLKKELGEYYIGFYSSAGNIIRDVTYFSNVPEHWRTNIHNTDGGRISFIENGFKFENCAHDAEIEQKEIELKAGTYFLDYKQQPVKALFDIKPYVFAAHSEKKDKNFEDDKKNILKDGKIILEKDTIVNLKFVGQNGIINEVCIKDDTKSSFVETTDRPVSLDGSYITVFLTKLKFVKWTGHIKDLPTFTDYTKECPYGIIRTKECKITKDEANVALNKDYDFVYDVSKKKLRVYAFEQEIAEVNVALTPEDKDELDIFYNMDAIISALILVDERDHEIDVIHQKTFRRYVPAEITSPILISKLDHTPLDISAAYREVSSSSRVIELFSMEMELKLSGKAIDRNIEVYGISQGTQINSGENTIAAFAKSYATISSEHYEICGKVIKLNNEIRKKYKYIAISYEKIEDFTYNFTNYEREIFSDEPRMITEKNIADVNGGITIYGCKTKPDIQYLYRIPSALMTNSIDLCVDEYDMLSGEVYEVNYANNEIKVAEDVRRMYPYFIVDYLKKDSYAINYRDDLLQYEVDISMDDEKGILSYDMSDDGNTSNKKFTVIKPDHNKFIILRRREEEFE